MVANTLRTVGLSSFFICLFDFFSVFLLNIIYVHDDVYA